MNNLDSYKAVSEIIDDTLLRKVNIGIKMIELKDYMKPFTSKHAIKNMEHILYENAYIMQDPRTDDQKVHEEGVEAKELESKEPRPVDVDNDFQNDYENQIRVSDSTKADFRQLIELKNQKTFVFSKHSYKP